MGTRAVGTGGMSGGALEDVDDEGMGRMRAWLDVEVTGDERSTWRGINKELRIPADRRMKHL